MQTTKRRSPALFAVLTVTVLQTACLGISEDEALTDAGPAAPPTNGTGGAEVPPLGGEVAPPVGGTPTRPDAGHPVRPDAGPQVDPDAGPPPAGCRSDADCALGLACDAASGACVEPGPCDNDRDCPEGTLCENAVCVVQPIACQTDRDCPEPTVCLEGLCTAGTPCGGDVCTGDEICQDGACVPPATPDCRTNDDCPANTFCDAGVCTPNPPPGACIDDSDCDPGRVCLEGACADAPPPPDCGVDADCGAGRVCRAGACVAAPPECAQDADCAGNEVCTNGACVPDLPGCLNDADCAADQICTQGMCVARPPECRNDADCRAPEVCRNGECVAPPPECVVDADCGAGRRCQAGACIAVVVPCDADLDCAAGTVCLNGTCSVPAGVAPRACNPRAAQPGCANTELCIPIVACAPDAANCRGQCAPSTCDACQPSEACGGRASSCVPGTPAAFCAPAGGVAEGGDCEIDGALYCQAGLSCLYGKCRQPCGGAACGAGNQACPADQTCRDFAGVNGGNSLELCHRECDQALQRGCAVGEACIATYYDAAIDRQIGMCSDAAPSGRRLQNEACVPAADHFWGDCRADHLCTDALSPGNSICFGTCTAADTRNCTGPSACALGTQENEPDAGFCIGDCNVWGAQPGCGGGETCQLAAVGTTAAGIDVFTGMCTPGLGNLAIGDPCDADAATGASDCPAGSVCADGTGLFFGTVCTRLCDLTPNSGHACPAGETCTVNIYGSARGRGVSPNLGICQ